MFEPEGLSHAATSGLKLKGKQEESKLIAEAVFTTPTRALIETFWSFFSTSHAFRIFKAKPFH